MSLPRNLGLVLNVALLTGGRTIATLYADGRFRAHGAIVPVALDQPVTTRARAVALSGRRGNSTYALTPSVLEATAAKRNELGKFATPLQAIEEDNRLAHLSKHDRKTLVRKVTAAYAE